MSVSSQFDKNNIPVDFLWLDIEHTDEKKYFTWDHTKFPNPKEMQESLGSFGRKMVTITDPHIKRKGGFFIHDQAVSNQLYVKKSRESPNEDFQGQCWSGDSSWLDFFNKKVRDFYSEMFSFERYQHSTRHLHNWIDMNEPSVFSGPEITMPRNALHTLTTTNDNQKGLTSRQVEHGMVHNLYGFLHVVSSMRGLKNRFLPRQATPGTSGNVPSERSLLLSRSFFLGLPGAIANLDQDPSATNPIAGGSLAIWTGDNAAKWEHLEMSIDMLLTLSLTGMGFSGADVGGFFGNPTEDLLVRWYQVGAFYPFFRAHAHIETKRREPYLFDEVTLDQIRTAIQSRYILAPYWYTLFADWCAAYLPSPSNRSHVDEIGIGTPIRLAPMRHLLLHYDGQVPLSLMRSSPDARMHFLLGKDLLVRAIAQPGIKEAVIFLPGRGELWYDYSTGLRIDQGTIRAEDGGKWVTLPVTMKQIPVFQRGGSVIPKKERARRTSELMRNDPYTLQIALDSNGNATGYLYDDDGFTFEYLDGHFIRRRFEMRSARELSNLDARPASAQPNTKFRTPCVVERIVILGFTRKPSVIRLQSHIQHSTPSQRIMTTVDARHGSVADPAVSGSVEVEQVFDFEFDAPSQRLVIRRPWLPIDKQWSILIE